MLDLAESARMPSHVTAGRHHVPGTLDKLTMEDEVRRVRENVEKDLTERLRMRQKLNAEFGVLTKSVSRTTPSLRTRNSFRQFGFTSPSAIYHLAEQRRLVRIPAYKSCEHVAASSTYSTSFVTLPLLSPRAGTK